jgi:hypothetical protein
MDHVALDWARPHDGQKVRGLIRGSIDICARDSIWKVPRVSAFRIIA